MPSSSALASFALASLVLLLVPGPAVLFIVARSSAHGPRAGIVSVLGVHGASIVHVVAAVVGLSALVVASASAFTVVKVVGGCYLIYLGARTLLTIRGPGGPIAVPERRHRDLFVEGFVVNLFNPKVALFFLAFVPQFVEPERGAVWSQTLLLGVLYIALGLMTDGLYALLGGRAGSWVLRRTTSRQRLPRAVEGSILIGLGTLTLALPQRRR